MMPKEIFKQINWLYLALLLGQLFFVGTVIFLVPAAYNFDFSGNVFLYIVPLVMLSSTLIGYWLQNKKKEEAARLETDLEGKLLHYRQTTIMRCALIEGPNLLAIVGFFISHNIYLLAFFAIGLILFLQARPSVEHFSQLYNISTSEQNSLLRDSA